MGEIAAQGSVSANPEGETDDRLNSDPFFIAASSTMHQIRRQAERVANLNVPVLLLGESGTGKEVTAKLIHRLSSRARSRFLKVNCAAFPSELLESELFGYERGAFTGAMRTKIGKFELCHKGTILLDEIGEMPTPLQAKLLHVLQDNQFSRLGGNETIEVDVRILAATNIDVRRAIAERRLREDLYYRLSAFTVELPPLRARKEEISLLLGHFMRRNAAQCSCPPRSFSSELLEACLEYDWPGNLRELDNFVRRYVVMGDETLAIRELQAKREEVEEAGCKDSSRVDDPVPTSLDDGHIHSFRSFVRNAKDGAEIRAITHALEETSWNRKRAAKILNISYRALLYKIRQHELNPFDRPGARPRHDTRAQ